MPEIGRKMLTILRILAQLDGPLGISRLATELSGYGVDLTPRAIRYHLQRLDEAGLTEPAGRQGRRITELGRQELADAMLTVAAMDPCYSCTERVAVVRKRLGGKREVLDQRRLLQMSREKTERIRKSV